jgi:hypothetical protein
MKRDDVDLFVVPDGQLSTHIRLENWSRWVTPGSGSSVCPMFRMAKSNARQWHVPELRPTCNTKDAQHIEKVVRGLPVTHRELVRWYYVARTPEMKVRRKLGLTRQDLVRLVIDARQMVQNLAGQER